MENCTLKREKNFVPIPMNSRTTTTGHYKEIQACRKLPLGKQQENLINNVVDLFLIKNIISNL